MLLVMAALTGFFMTGNGGKHCLKPRPGFVFLPIFGQKIIKARKMSFLACMKPVMSAVGLPWQGW